jgi:SAM-dependent methyltransferase
MSEFDGYKDIYDREIEKALSFVGQPQDFFTTVKADNLVRLFNEHFCSSQPLHVLDVGCGVGKIHPFLINRRSHLHLSGIDVARDLIADARERQPYVAYDAYDGDILPYSDGAFDVAFTICVMHHVPPPQWGCFISEMRRVVRPGGLVIAIEHNPLNPLTLWVVNNCPLDKHAVLLRSGQLTRLMRESGLNCIQRYFILFTPFSSSFFRSVDRALKRVPFGAQYIAYSRRP